MAKVKLKQQPKKGNMVESEMFPGKMIPKSAVRKGAYITTNTKKSSKTTKK